MEPTAPASPEDAPIWLWHRHRATAPGTTITADLSVIENPIRRLDVVAGAGFRVVGPDRLVRERTLADTVGPGLRMLIVGLNPSLYAADAGVGFARPGNRFWPAASAAGLVSVDRDPMHAYEHHRIGMTDLVKRATARADELDPTEYVAGVARLERLCEWLRPAAVCVAGLTGWRAAVDRRAVRGWQAGELGGCPVFVMPNPSGLNARVSAHDLAADFRSAVTGRQLDVDRRSPR